MTRRVGVLAAVLCLIAAAFLYSYDMMARTELAEGSQPRQLLGQVPWFLFFLGLVWLWRALARTVREAVLFGAGLVIVGTLSLIVEPWLILFGVHWLIVVGFVFPVWIALTARFPRRPPRSGRSVS